MRTNRTSILFVALSSLAFSGIGCASGRTPEVYRDDTEKVLQSANQSITDCYNGVLKGGAPTAQGSVTVHFIVHEDTGEIRRAKVDKARSTAPEAVQACVVQYLNGLHLAPPDEQRGDAMFTYDFSVKEPQVIEQPAAEGDKPAT